MGKSISLFLFIFYCSMTNMLAQTNYQTIADGDWSNPVCWYPNVPPSPLPATDSIIIRHQINYNISQDILGTMIITAGSAAVSIGGKHNLRIGRGGIEEGLLLVYGNLRVNDLEVKPDNGCTPTMGLPQIQNFGSITCNDDFQIGNNCAAGLLINHVGAKIYVNDQIHLDHYICNNDSIFVGNVLKVHGGTLDCCGYFQAPMIDVDANPTGRPSSFECTNICDTSGFAPTINVSGSDFVDLNDAYYNAPVSETSFDDDSTFICDFNQTGTLNALPIELSLFKAQLMEESRVLLQWTTETETNHAFFVLERSHDAQSWLAIAQIEGNNNSVEQQHYAIIDNNPLAGRSYYRLKHVATNGQYGFSKVLTIQLNGYQKIEVFPNPFKDKIQIIASLDELSTLYLLNAQGTVVSLDKFPVEVFQFYAALDLSTLEGGVYFLRTKNNVQKIVKL